MDIIIYYDDLASSDLLKNYLVLLEKVKSIDTEEFLEKIADKGVTASDRDITLYLKKDSTVKDFIVEATTQDNYKTICLWLSNDIKNIKSKFWDLLTTFIVHECVHIKRYELAGEDQNTSGLTDDSYLLDERELNAYAIQSLYAKEHNILDFADDQYYEYGNDDIYDTFLIWQDELAD